MAKFISKTDRLIPKNWDYPESIVPVLPTLNYEMLNSMLAQQQGQFDLAKTISEKNPNVLQTAGDQELYNQYRQMVDTGLNNVSKAYAEQGAAEGSRQYRQYVESMRKAWQPNGVASALQDRYTSYYNAKKAIDDFYKDDVRPVNKTLAYRELQKQLQDPINYNNGTYKQIVTPQTYKDPDLRKAINEMIKQIDDSGDTEFLGDRNKSWWIEKIKTTGRPEDKIRLAAQALSEQPEFAAQLQRDARYQSLSIDPAKHQALFNSKIDKQLSNLESQINGKLGKDILEQQGYDTKDLNKAKKEFLDDQKRLAQQKKDNYDLNTELTRDVTEDYINYAAGFASQKVDKDLIYNKKLADQAKIQATREKTAALLSISDKLLQKEGPSVTVTSGVAQQLPELGKHYNDLKTKQTELKTGLEKRLTDPNSTFNGWRMEDVAFARNLWKSTMSKLPANASEQQKREAFGNALQSSGSYQWKPEQLDKVYQEFSSVNGSSVDPLFTAYQETQNEIERIDNARTYVGQQYINTPEGKEAFKGIASQRRSGETDEQLIQRAINNPESFKIRGPATTFAEPGGFRGRNLDYNPAEVFNNTMQRDIKNQQKNGQQYDWGDMATYQVGFNKGDKTFLNIGNSIGSAVTNGTPYQFSSEGKQGLTFRDSKGDVIDNISKVDLGDFVIGKNTKGQPVINYKAVVTPEGGKSKDATLSIDIVSGSPEWEQIKSGLEAAYIAKVNAGEQTSADAIADIINTVEKGVDLSDASTQIMVNNLTKAKTQPLNDILIPDASGNLVPASYKGYSGMDTKNTYETFDPLTGATMTYEIYGIIDQTGNKYVAEVFVAPDGRKVITDVKQNMSSIRQKRKGKEIIAKTPVERETVKISQGQAVNLMQNVIQANE